MKERYEPSGLRWTIDELAGDDIPIKIYDKDGKVLVEYLYKCTHRPIFGLDVDDIAEINKILDQLLKECEVEETEKLEKESKTGHWTITNRNGVNMYVCSECNNEPLLIGSSYPIFKLSDYCPYCGTKMEVKE